MPTMVERITNFPGSPAADAFSNVAQGLQNAATQKVQTPDFQDAIEAFDGISGNSSVDDFSSAKSEMNPFSHLQSINDSSEGTVQFFGGISSADVLSQMQNPQLDLDASLTKFSDSLTQGAEFADDFTRQDGQSVPVFSQTQKLLTSMLTNLANMKHEMLKAVANNLRA